MEGLLMTPDPQYELSPEKRARIKQAAEYLNLEMTGDKDETSYSHWDD